MRTVIYDGTFAGLLTAVFDIFEYKYTDVTIAPDGQGQHNIFGNTHHTYTDDTKALRVWNGLKQRISAVALSRLSKTFLSEQPGMEDKLLQYMQHAFASRASIEHDHTHGAVQYVTGMAKKVHREKHRMEAFVRFQQTKDGLYYATVDPDFNVLPLISVHFTKRYADQLWMIYDVKRKYGLYYDLHQTSFVNVTFNDTAGNETAVAAILDEAEVLYQQLWQKYFTSVNIPARRNMKLHIQHMPYRYWKYLIEKQPLLR